VDDLDVLIDFGILPLFFTPANDHAKFILDGNIRVEIERSEQSWVAVNRRAADASVLQLLPGQRTTRSRVFGLLRKLFAGFRTERTAAPDFGRIGRSTDDGTNCKVVRCGFVCEHSWAASHTLNQPRRQEIAEIVCVVPP